MEFTVQAISRTESSKPNTLRRNGMIPAVMYGHDGTNAVSISITAKDAEQLVQSASVNNSIINVQVPDLSLDCKALLRDIQTNALGSKLNHLSFFAIAAQASVHVTVPIYLKGQAIGVTLNKGNLDQSLNVVELQCAPDVIPASIDIDITNFDVGSALHVSELDLPSGVTVVGEHDRIVFSITE